MDGDIGGCPIPHFHTKKLANTEIQRSKTVPWRNFCTKYCEQNIREPLSGWFDDTTILNFSDYNFQNTTLKINGYRISADPNISLTIGQSKQKTDGRWYEGLKAWLQWTLPWRVLYKIILDIFHKWKAKGLIIYILMLSSNEWHLLLSLNLKNNGWFIDQNSS